MYQWLKKSGGGHPFALLLLQRRGAKVTYSDPFIPRIKINDTVLEAQDMVSSVESADCVVIVTDHTGVDYAKVVERSKLIVDSRNALKKYRSDKIVRL